MRLLLCGDVVGRSGRSVIVEPMPRLRRDLALDFVVANGENAAHGFGITDKICEELYAAGVDVITTGNHVWDKREIIPYIAGDPRLLRPVNFPPVTPGRGHGVFVLADGRKLLVIYAIARIFMYAIVYTFTCVARLIAAIPPASLSAILVFIRRVTNT